VGLSVGKRDGVPVAASVGVTMGGIREGDSTGRCVTEEVIVVAGGRVAAGNGRLPSASESENPPINSPAEISAVMIPQMTCLR